MSDLSNIITYLDVEVLYFYFLLFLYFIENMYVPTSYLHHSAAVMQKTFFDTHASFFLLNVYHFLGGSLKICIGPQQYL